MAASILVTGATGNIGREVARQLAARGVKFRAGVHQINKVPAELKKQASGIVALDYADAASLEKALDGVQKAFFLSPLTQDLVEAGDRFVAAAKKATVRHIVRASALGADADAPITLGRWHRAVERAVEASGIAYTHVRPGVFMQNVSNMAATSIKAAGVLAQPWGDGKIAFVDVRDVAAVVVSALTAQGHEGQAYDVTGPEALSGAQVAAALGTVLEKRVVYTPLTDAEAEGYLTSVGIPQWFVAAMTELNGAARAGHLARITDVVARIGGKKPYTFREFVRDTAATFR